MLNVLEILEDFYRTKEVKLVHVDEILSNDLLLTKEDMFFNSIKVYNDIIISFKKDEILSFQINLLFELNGGENTINGVPKNISSLIDLIDEFSMPEISIFIPEKRIWQPKMEIYLCPIPFKISDLSLNVSSLYEEYRTLDEFTDKSEFHKWLTFSYIEDNQVF